MIRISSKIYLKILIGITLLISAVLLTTNMSYAAYLSDIEGHWAQDDIKFMEAKGAISGYEDGTFRPNNSVTAAEAIKLVVANFDKDLQNGEEYWASTYFDYAKMTAIIKSNQYELGELNRNITRKEVIYMVINSIEKLAFKPVIKNNDVVINFNDTATTINENGIDYYSAIKKAYLLGIVIGDENKNMNPNSNITRAELVAILTRAYNEGRRQYKIEYREENPYIGIYDNVMKMMPNSFYEFGLDTFAKYKTSGTPYYYATELFYDYSEEGIKDSKINLDTAVSALFNVSYDMSEEEWTSWKNNMRAFNDIFMEYAYNGENKKLEEYIQYVIDNKIAIRGGALIDPLTFGNMKGTDGKYKLSVKGIVKYIILSNPNNVKKLTYADYVSNKTSIYNKNYDYLLLELIDLKDKYQMNNMQLNSTSVTFVEN